MTMKDRKDVALLSSSDDAIKLIKEFEGYSATPYICPAGRRTIGYGYVILLSDKIKKDEAITEERANRFLKKKINQIERKIKKTVTALLSQGEFDALVSLIYNWGAFAFSKSTGLRQLNTKLYKDAAKEFFSKEKGVVNINKKFSNGLYRRRQAELNLWDK